MFAGGVGPLNDPAVSVPQRDRVEARRRAEQGGWTAARASAGPQGGPETSPRRREAARQRSRRSVTE